MLGNQVVPSVRADLCNRDASLAALLSNVGGQQGIQAGLMAALDFAAGGRQLDPDSNLPLITVEYVQCTRRLLDISVAVREMWRESPDELQQDVSVWCSAQHAGASRAW